MERQGMGFIECPCACGVSMRNLRDKPPEMVQKTSVVLLREGALRLTAGW